MAAVTQGRLIAAFRCILSSHLTNANRVPSPVQDGNRVEMASYSPILAKGVAD
jgi:hypothetical protein